LEKGDVIEIERIQEITGWKCGTNEYRFALLALRDRVFQELRDRGCPATVITDSDRLQILTDTEAAEYNRRMFVKSRKAMARAFIRNTLVDVNQLTDSERREHSEDLLIQSRILLSQRRAARRLPPPGLSEPAEPQAE